LVGVISQTYLVLVAIEEYPNLGSAWRLPDVGVRAVEFARWIIEDGGLPKSNVRAFANGTIVPALIALGLDKAQIFDPKNEGISNFFAELGARFPDGEILLLYWTGHGFVSRDSVGGLLLADAIPSQKTNLDVDQLIRLLRSAQAGNFRRQFAI